MSGAIRSLPPASVARRVEAGVFDFLLVMTALPFALVIVDEVFDASLLALALTSGAGFVGYPTLAHWMHGRTIGKALLGITVEDFEGQSPSLWRSMIRSFATFLPPVTIITVTILVYFRATGGNTAEDDAWSRFFSALVRFLFGLVFGIGLALAYVVIGIVLMRNQRDHRALHDLVAGTRVRRDTK